VDVAFDNNEPQAGLEAGDHQASAAPHRRGAGGRPRRPGVSDAILTATIELAAEGGIEEITLNAVADRAGVGRPTIYRRWPSKEALLEDVVTRITATHTAMPAEGPIRERLVDWFARAIEGVQGPLRTLYEAYFNVRKMQFGTAGVQAADERTETMIRAAIKAGELRSDTDPHLLMQLMFGIIWYRAVATGEHMDPSYAETVVDAVLNSWLTPNVAFARREAAPEPSPELVLEHAAVAAGPEPAAKPRRGVRK
jgi:AcrR family transcriptional regulator